MENKQTVLPTFQKSTEILTTDDNKQAFQKPLAIDNQKVNVRALKFFC